jgi:RNA polymerase sigma-70 factor (ECF subfamily)
MQTLTTPDRELVERARQYDTRALAEIYDRYAEPIYRYLYRFVGDAVQAEDLTSEVFLKLLQVLDTPRAPGERLLGWLYGVAHNLATDWFRSNSRHPAVSLAEDLVADGELPSTILEKRQANKQLRAALRRLTADQQRVILLRFGEGFKLGEVARLLGKSEGAVKILQHRAVKHLRKLLES